MRYLPIFLFLFLLQCKDNNPDHSANQQDVIASEKSDSEIKAESLKKDSLLKVAFQNLQKDSNKLENIIWYVRRLAYLERYEEAIDVYTQGLKKFPRAPELFRQRGHRYITLRKFDEAISDFEKAAFFVKNRAIEIEPDGIPNKLNKPLSSLQFNIWYHWGLAYYLKGDFSRAAQLYERCMEYSTNPDLLCATSDWLYMTFRRLGQIKKANALLEDIKEDMKIIENSSYHKRLLMYKGLKKPKELYNYENKEPESSLDIVTQGYGVGNLYLYNRDTASAKLIFDKLLESGYQSAFGYIAAEADMRRINSKW